MTQRISRTRLITRLLFLVPFAAILCNPSPGLAAAPAVAPSLGSASGFAVLGGGAVTCTNSTVFGDVGSAGGVVTGCTPAGTVHAGDTVAQNAYADFLTAYDTLSHNLPGASDPCVGSTSVTLPTKTIFPGVYCFAAALTLTNVTLTLDARGDPNAVWIFKIGTGGTGALTGTGLSVVMAGGGQPCNVYWWVAQDATLTGSNFFQGTILAGAAITLTGATTFNGGILAGGVEVTPGVPTGAVTLTGSTVFSCGASPGVFPPGFPPGGKCEERNDKDRDHDKDKDRDHDKDNDHKDNDRKDKKDKDDDGKDGKRR